MRIPAFLSKSMNCVIILKKNLHLLFKFKRANITKLAEFYRSFKKYKNLVPSDEVSLLDISPFLDDKTNQTSFDPHYFYQGFWAFKRIKESCVQNHVDVGSEIKWAGILSSITRVRFIDIRPFETDLQDLIVEKGDILRLSFSDNSVNSLSCLHVAEHVGLGRYGDNIDPEGTKQACRELSRILAFNGCLYFSVPVGKQKTFFNAHRIHSPFTIIDYFEDLKLIELSGVTDTGRFIENIDINILVNSNYACGLFLFRKELE
jgi:hypothetical protein